MLFQHHNGKYDRGEIKTTWDFQAAIKYYRPMTVSSQGQYLLTVIQILIGAAYQCDKNEFRSYKKEVQH